MSKGSQWAHLSCKCVTIFKENATYIAIPSLSLSSTAWVEIEFLCVAYQPSNLQIGVLSKRCFKSSPCVVVPSNSRIINRRGVKRSRDSWHFLSVISLNIFNHLIITCMSREQWSMNFRQLSQKGQLIRAWLRSINMQCMWQQFGAYI